MFKFRNVQNLEDFLMESCGKELRIPSASKNEVVLFQNGDKMTVSLETGELQWEPVIPGEIFTSRLSLRLHQWFGKGIIVPIK